MRDLFKTLNVPTLMRVTKLGEMPITLRIHTPYIHLLNVRDKIGGDANYLTDSHIICTSLNVIHKIGGDANLLTDDFLEKHSGCLGAFAAAFGQKMLLVYRDICASFYLTKLVSAVTAE